MLEAIIENYDIDIKDFSKYAIIINSTDTLQKIYTKLDWNYQSPVFNPDVDNYIMIGYPNNQAKTIGYGETSDEAISDARQYLINMGYVVTVFQPERYFS